MRCLCLLGLATMLFAPPVFAYNEHGSLAIHLVASYEYLQCDDLCPPGMTCEEVNCDLSLVEIEASGGYGYAAFVAYNIEQVVALEFYVVGWPTGPGTPDFTGPTYCPDGGGWVVGEPLPLGLMFSPRSPSRSRTAPASSAWTTATSSIAPSVRG